MPFLLTSLRFFALALFTCSTSFASFDKAMEIYADERFDEAKIAFEALAAIGDRRALFNLGVMHYLGEGMQRDVVRAYALISIAGKGAEEPIFSDSADKILKAFSEQQDLEAAALLAELTPVYDPRVIAQNLFPKPLNDEDCVPERLAMLKKAPVYPQYEIYKGRMGMTDVEFTVSPQGYVRDIYAVSSTSEAFTKSSLRAAARFRYKPPSNNLPVFGLRNRFTYALELDGTSRVKTKTLKKDLDQLKADAERGDAVAQYRYARKLNSYRSFQEYLGGVDLQYRQANEWYLKSAKNGVVNAQFEIGRNMIEGRGCAVDAKNGLKWINVSALGGYSPAQTLLAQKFLENSDTEHEGKEGALRWLRSAALSKYYPARVMLAWELATSENSIDEGLTALGLLDESDSAYLDPVRVMETKAAAYARLGHYSRARKYQKKAIKLADQYKWNIPVMQERLAAYVEEKRWFGRYF